MLKLNSVRKSYENKTVLSDINLEIKDKIIAIKGKSGVGKSTLLSIIGLLEDFEGKYSIDDTIINKKNKEKIRHNYFTYIFQNALLIPYYSVYDNIVLPLKNEHKSIDNNLILSLARRLEIYDILDKKANLISGGEAMRCAICRALLSDKKYILADEPTGSLDPETANIVMNLFIQLIKDYDKNIIMVTHSNNFDNYFEKIYSIKDGKIYEENNK